MYLLIVIVMAIFVVGNIAFACLYFWWSVDLKLQYFIMFLVAGTHVTHCQTANKRSNNILSMLKIMLHIVGWQEK